MNQSNQSQAAKVYGGITRQIAGQTPGGRALSKFANVPAGRPSTSYYDSRVSQAKINGEGPTINPVNAPWSFTDFVYGGRSLATARSAPAKTMSGFHKLRKKLGM